MKAKGERQEAGECLVAEYPPVSVLSLLPFALICQAGSALEYAVAGEESLGKIEVSRRAVATIVAGAVLGCYGVVGMASRNLRDGLGEALRRHQYDRGIDVRMSAEGVAIEVFVIVEYGTRITEVGKNVAEAVRFAVERSLGVPVKKITVNVQGLRISEGR